MDILLSTNNTTLTFHTIEAVNINKERHHTCSIYMEWNITLFKFILEQHYSIIDMYKQ